MNFKNIFLVLSIIIASPIAAYDSSLVEIVNKQIKSLKRSNFRKTAVITGLILYILHEKGVNIKEKFNECYGAVCECGVTIGKQGITLTEKIGAMIENFKKENKEKNIEKNNDDSKEEKK